MRPFDYWTRPHQPNELMCIVSGAIRPTLHLPEHKVDAVTRCLGPLIEFALAQHEDGTRRRG